MQPLFSCVPPLITGIEKALSPARLGRYLPAANGDRQLALRLYVWNSRLCEEFYIPTQFAEVSFRNALNQGLIARYGSSWHYSSGFVSGLPDRLQDQVAKVIRDETVQHGAAMTVNHIVSSLPLGFWLHLCSTGLRGTVWKGKLRGLFAHLPTIAGEQDIYNAVDRLRRFRNRIAHHDAIFDKRPLREFKNIEAIIGWTSPEALWLMRQISSPARAINGRPRC